MRFFLNGIEGGAAIHVRSADTLLNVLFVNDDGTPLNLAAPAVVTVEFFTTEERTDAPLATITVTPHPTASAAGYGTVLISDTNLDLERGTLYVWGRHKTNSGTGSGTVVSVGVSAGTLQVI